MFIRVSLAMPRPVFDRHAPEAQHREAHQTRTESGRAQTRAFDC
jgi:hypothetical protein